ncbi:MULTISPECIES: sensor histidine kinase [Streptomyces]|nr:MULTISPECIES: HAMP domain-containing sensor histidine kinase [Streptomyces]AZK97289.1 two-component sensor histidine kinase [Streptomyces tsukubensis]EIF93425.1 integral membrane sensor signal transduction histidine kinase [Streptomyces tsukubensis NRRL18488]
MILRALGGSLRVRLTAVFGLMFFVAGAAIFGGALILVGNSMQYTLSLPFPTVERTAGSSVSQTPQGPGPRPETSPETSPETPPPATIRPTDLPTDLSTDRPTDLPTEKLGGGFAVPADGRPENQGITIDPASRDHVLATMQTNLMAKGGLTVLVVGVIATTMGWLVAGRLLRPLNRITSTAERIAGRTLHQRIGLDEPPGEVKRLADSFDSMLDRLDQAFAGQDRFIANAAHELKTPLAVGRTLVEVAVARRNAPPEVRQLGENLLAVNERHERLIDALLTLARAESAPAESHPVDLAAVAESVLTHTAADAQRRRLQVQRILAPAPALGDPVLLEQLVRNLVDNAVKYNVPDGVLSVHTGTGPLGAYIAVGNTGAVIEAHEIPVLFEPFRRLTDRVGSARGSGLGLSIVRAVARAHQGDTTAEPRAGGGLTVTATLPLPKGAHHGPAAATGRHRR